MSNTTSKPIFKKQLGFGIAAAVFETTRDGHISRSVNLQKSYRKNGEWTRHNIYIDHQHIPFMIEALTATWNFLNGDATTLPNTDGESTPTAA